MCHCRIKLGEENLNLGSSKGEKEHVIICSAELLDGDACDV